MRRFPIPGGGWLLLAAMAFPIVVRASRPLARKFGQGIKKVGETIIDATSEPARSNATAEQKQTEVPSRSTAEGHNGDPDIAL